MVLYWVQLSNLRVRLRAEQAMKEEPYFGARQPGTSIKRREVVIRVLDLQSVFISASLPPAAAVPQGSSVRVGGRRGSAPLRASGPSSVPGGTTVKGRSQKQEHAGTQTHQANDKGGSGET